MESDIYDRLRELRHIRNQMAHGERFVLRIIPAVKKMFYGFSSSGVRSCISQGPLAVYRRQTEESMHATRVKEDFHGL